MDHSAPSRVVDFEQARALVEEHARLLARRFDIPTERVSLVDSFGRVLAEEVHADRDQPPFSRSTRDGFACHAADLVEGREISVLGQVRAGELWRPAKAGLRSPSGARVGPGCCVEIMTGAPVPDDCDCVVMLEQVEQSGGKIRLLSSHPRGSPLRPGANIVPRGAEARSGEMILPRGIQLGAAQIGAAAAFGKARVDVFSPPRVAILPTGDELVGLDEDPLPHQIRNSNSFSLAAQVTACKGRPIQLGIARDRVAELERAVARGAESDLLLLSGGVSVGKYDLVEQVLSGMGAEFLFTGVLIQPGKPLVFGRFPGSVSPKYFFGLPGNPLSTMVTFSLFVEPLIQALGGRRASGFVRGELAGEFRGKAGLTRFLPARYELAGAGEGSVERGDPKVELIPSQGSGDLAAASRANCFVVVPSDRTTLHSGEAVNLLVSLPIG